jgi:hypothetical protein
MNAIGFNDAHTPEAKPMLVRLKAFRDRYRTQTAATLAVLAALTFIAAQYVPSVQHFILTSGLVLYVNLIVLLDLAVFVYLLQRPPASRAARNQDESMPWLIEALGRCRTEGADLLEYAGSTTLPLIRAIRRQSLPMRMLVKHPETVIGFQKQRNLATLDTLYTSVFSDYEGSFEIRCYRQPFSLRGRRLGNEIVELGWLTLDVPRQTAFGHANPSIVADLSNRDNQNFRFFFDRTFEALWNDQGTEDGRAVLKRLQPQPDETGGS